MKAKTIGYYKNVQNVGDVNAAVDLKVGMGVVLNRAARTANLPASEEEAKACFRIVSNINDKPEMRNFEETLTVKAGEKVLRPTKVCVCRRRIMVLPLQTMVCLLMKRSRSDLIGD